MKKSLVLNSLVILGVTLALTSCKSTIPDNPKVESSRLSTAVISEYAFGYPKWKALKPGSKIHCIAPGWGDNDEKLELATGRIKAFGFKVTWNKAAFKQKDPLCPERAMMAQAAFEDLMDALRDPSVDAIWAFRGGRGTLELWEFLRNIPAEELATLPRKPIIGFSDITSLHLWFNAHGFPTIHGPVALFGPDIDPSTNGETDLTPTVDILMGKKDTLVYHGLLPLNASAKSIQGSVRGTLIGGNLASLTYFKATYGKGPLPSRPTIFIIEDIANLENATRLESVLTALRMGDILKNTQAIILGQFHGESATSAEFDAVQDRYNIVVQRFASKTKIPVFTTILKKESLATTFQFGHGSYNDPLPLGFPAELTLGAHGGADPMSTTLKISGATR
jgi:muramoyltetrapeptide carboxypeptidase